MGSAFFAKKKNCPFLKYLHKNHDTTKMDVIANDNFLKTIRATRRLIKALRVSIAEICTLMIFFVRFPVVHLMQ